MLIIDAANVVGSRPNGWWRDRGKAAADLCREISDAIGAGRLAPPVVVLLEGKARSGMAEGEHGDVRVVHAEGSGDDAIAALAADGVATGESVAVVTADRELRDRCGSAGADVVGPRWLFEAMSGRDSDRRS